MNNRRAELSRFVVPLDVNRIRVSATRIGYLPLALLAHVGIRGLDLVVLGLVGRTHGWSAYSRLIHWDAGWYRQIAMHGYGLTRLHPDGRLLSDYAFFPLYPALERLISELTGLRVLGAGLVISAAASVVAAWGMFLVARQIFDGRTGFILVVLWSALPISIVQSMAYTESLFTALAAWALYSMMRDRFIAAGVLAALSGLTRPMGVAVALAVVVGAVVRLRDHRRTVVLPDAQPLRSPSTSSLVLGAIIAPLGAAGFLGWVAVRTGSLSGYFAVTSAWGNGFDGGAAFVRWIAAMLTSPEVLLGLLVAASLGLLICVFVSMLRHGYPLGMIVYTSAALLIALSTSGYFGSKPRYLLPVFTLLLPPAVALGRARKSVLSGVLIACIAASGFYGAVWLCGPGPP